MAEIIRPSAKHGAHQRAKLSKLEAQRDELRQAQREFIEALPEHQRNKLCAAKNNHDAVMDIVDDSVVTWMHRNDRAEGAGTYMKTKFHACCRALDQHSAALDLLPGQSEYVALFYGSVKVVVQASVNYQMLAENMPKILGRINSTIEAVKNEVSDVKDADDPRIGYLTELYILIFRLLARIIRWCEDKSRRRLWKSLHRDCFKEFNDEADMICAESQNISRWMASNMAKNVATSAKAIEAMDKRVEELVNLVNQFQSSIIGSTDRDSTTPSSLPRADLDYIAERLTEGLVDRFMLLRMGNPASSQSQTRLLLESASVTSQEALGKPPAVMDKLTKSNSSVTEARSSSQQDIATSTDKQQWTKSSILQASAKLEDWYPPGHNAIQNAIEAVDLLNHTVEDALSAFLSRTASRILYLELGATAADPDATPLSTAVASQMLSLATSVGYPKISYFCSLPRTAPAHSPDQGTGWREKAALIELMSSLIRQLLVIQPETLLLEDTEFQSNAFEAFDGTISSWDGMLAVFKQLLHLHSPPVLLIIIDGLHWLNSPLVDGRVAEMLEEIRDVGMPASDSKGVDQRVKLLLTTDAQVRGVVPFLKRGEYVVLDVDEDLYSYL